MAERLHSVDLPGGCLRWYALGSGPPLVLLHGWSMSHAVFRELAELLSDEFRLLIPDLPGHAGSAMLTPCDLNRFAAQVSAWLEHVTTEPVFLLGWSLGGQVALRLSALHPDLVRRLILISTTPRFCATNTWTAGLPEGELRVLKRGLQRRYLATMGEFFDRQFIGESLSEARRREILQFAVRPVGLPEPQAALTTLDILAYEDLRPDLPQVKHPALVIHGEADQIIPLGAGEYLAENLPDGQLYAMPGIGHAPFISQPQQVARCIREFCA